MDYQITVGQKIRYLREQKGLTLAEVAKAVDKSTSLIGSIERGDRMPSLPSLIEVAEFYQAPIAALFDDDVRNYHTQVATIIQNTLKEKGLTTAQLADQSGISYFLLADFLNGRAALSLDQLKQVATVLNISMKQIVPETICYINYIRHYLHGLGLDEVTITNVIEYIYSRFAD